MIDILRNQSIILKRLSVFIDLFLVGMCYLLAGYIDVSPQGHPSLFANIYYLPIFVIMWGALLSVFKMYEFLRVRGVWGLTVIVAKSGLSCFILFSGMVFVVGGTQISRDFVVVACALSGLLIILEKQALVFCLKYLRAKGLDSKRILIVGSGKRAQRFINLVEQHGEWGITIIGILDADPEKVGHLVGRHKIIGTLDYLENMARDHAIDDVLFIVPRSWLSQLEGMIHHCEAAGVRVSLAVDHFDLKFSRSSQHDFQGFPMLTFESTPDNIWHLVVKRTVDILASGLGLMLLSPVLLAVYLIIKLTSKGPALFRQNRYGLNGRIFTFYKFRTMVLDAESKLQELKKNNEMSGPAFKMSDDPRILPVGKYLRKFSLDELPQLWNVFVGDMSLVGPRPLPSDEKQYDNWHWRRYSMRPGITCIWQVSGRNNIRDFNDWVKLDLQYIDNWSLWLDLKILLQTVPTVLFHRGAK